MGRLVCSCLLKLLPQRRLLPLPLPLQLQEVRCVQARVQRIPFSCCILHCLLCTTSARLSPLLLPPLQPQTQQLSGRASSTQPLAR